MIQSEAKDRLRQLLNETAAGFWTDNELYDMLDSAQMMVASMLISRLESMKIQTGDRHVRLACLEELLTSATGNTTSGTTEYALAADFWHFDYATFQSDNTVATQYLCTKISSAYEGISRTYNSFASATVTKPYCYISGTNIGFLPTAGASLTPGYKYYYYKRPSSIASGTSGSEISLNEQTHDIIILVAHGLALFKDDRYQEAGVPMALAKEQLNLLV